MGYEKTRDWQKQRKKEWLKKMDYKKRRDWRNRRDWQKQRKKAWLKKKGYENQRDWRNRKDWRKQKRKERQKKTGLQRTESLMISMTEKKMRKGRGEEEMFAELLLLVSQMASSMAKLL